MLTGQDISITIDPQARIQGLLETTNRYLDRAREAEAKLNDARWDQVIDKHAFETLREMASERADRDEFAGLVLAIADDRLTDMAAIPSIPKDHPVFQ